MLLLWIFSENHPRTKFSLSKSSKALFSISLYKQWMSNFLRKNWWSMLYNGNYKIQTSDSATVQPLSSSLFLSLSLDRSTTWRVKDLWNLYITICSGKRKRGREKENLLFMGGCAFYLYFNLGNWLIEMCVWKIREDMCVGLCWKREKWVPLIPDNHHFSLFPFFLYF